MENNYEKLIKDFLPQGQIFDTLDEYSTAVIKTYAKVIEQFVEAINKFKRETNPQTTKELLGRFEKFYGIETDLNLSYEERLENLLAIILISVTKTSYLNCKFGRYTKKDMRLLRRHRIQNILADFFMWNMGLEI